MSKSGKPNTAKSKIAESKIAEPKIAKPAVRTKAAVKASRPTRDQAEDAVRTLLRWAGDDPGREGLLGTPARVARAYEEWFAGYFEDPREYLGRTFEEVAGYDEIVLLRDIRFESHCEHHVAPIIGRVHIAYLPRPLNFVQRWLSQEDKALFNKWFHESKKQSK